MATRGPRRDRQGLRRPGHRPRPVGRIGGARARRGVRGRVVGADRPPSSPPTTCASRVPAWRARSPRARCTAARRSSRPASGRPTSCTSRPGSSGWPARCSRRATIRRSTTGSSCAARAPWRSRSRPASPRCATAPRPTSRTACRLRRRPASSESRDVLADYAAYLRSLVDLSGIRPLTVVVDAGNGMAGHTVPAVLGDTRACAAAAHDRPAVLRAGRLVPQPRGESARAREPRRPAARGGRARRRPRARLRRRRRPVLRRRRGRRGRVAQHDHLPGRRARAEALPGSHGDPQPDHLARPCRR